MNVRLLVSTACLMSVAVLSGQPRWPIRAVSFRVHQLPMTGVRWAGPIGSLAVNPAHQTEVLAASTSGGLFRSDGGGWWTHVDTLPPSDLSTVQWAPTFGLDTVFVSTRDDFRRMTTFTPDGHIATRGTNTSGVWRSTDRGATWSQVLRLDSARPPDGVACDTRPMAFGMSADPIGRRLFVATKCGVWTTTTGGGGSFWLVPGTATSGTAQENRFYDVQVLLSGDVVALGERGLFYLPAPCIGDPACPAPGATSFVAATTVPAGLDFVNLGSDGNYRGAFSAAPRGDQNAFVVVRSATEGAAPVILYSRNAGRSWQRVPGPAGDVSGFRGGCGGAPFIRALLTPLSDNPNSVTLYYGDSCYLYKTGALPLPPNFNFGPLLPTISWTRFSLAHEDTHDFVSFGLLNAMVATDGGIEVCKRDGSAPCGETIGPEDGLNALQFLGLSGQRITDRPGLFRNPEYHLYASSWHTFLWSSANGEDWTEGDRAEGAELEMARVVSDRSETEVAYDRYALRCGECQYRLSGALFSGSENFPLAVGTTRRPSFFIPPGRAFSQLSDKTTPVAIWVAPDVRRGAVPAWTQVASIQDCGPLGAGECVPLMVWSDAQFGGYRRLGLSNPALYAVVANQRTGRDGRTLVQANAGLALVSDFLFSSGGEYSAGAGELSYPRMALAGGGQVTIGFNPATGWRRAVYAVDPSYAGRILAPDVASGQMVESVDGGDTWTPMPELTDLVTKGGRFVFSVTNDAEAIGVWPLVSAISFFPDDPNLVVLGTMNAGVFFSWDGGHKWKAVPGSTDIPSITKFHWKSANSVIIASAGRGLWELGIELQRRAFEALPSACPDCGFLTRLDVPLAPRGEESVTAPPPLQAWTDLPLDPTLLVLDGHVTGLTPAKSGGWTMGVTPGSSRVWFGSRQSIGLVEVVEQSQASGFAGLPQADQLLQQGLFVRGLSFNESAVTGIVYGKGDAPYPPANFTEFTKRPGTPTLGLNDKPYLLFKGLELGGASIPEGETLTVAGQNFSPGVVVVMIDEQVVAQAQVGQGAFELSIRVNVARGFHRLTAVQGQMQSGIRVVAPLRVVHRDPGEEK